jgi:hypothetical protein
MRNSMYRKRDAVLYTILAQQLVLAFIFSRSVGEDTRRLDADFSILGSLAAGPQRLSLPFR